MSSRNAVTKEEDEMTRSEKENEIFDIPNAEEEHREDGSAIPSLMPELSN